MFISKVERNEFVINSLLDNDFYKFTMQQYFFDKCYNSHATYEFKCRNKDINLTPYIIEIQKEINHLKTLKFKKDELEYLKSLKYFKEDYLLYLDDKFYDDFKSVNVCVYDDFNGNLEIKLDGNLPAVSMYEIYLLRIIHEVYSRNVNSNFYFLNNGRKILDAKKKFINDNWLSNPNIIDFGTRRAYSGLWHEEVVSELISIIKGTSNVLFAKAYNLEPIGTNAHEFFQTFQGLYPDRLVDSQKIAMEEWINYYKEDLGIVLSDTLGDDKFFKDFNYDLSKKFFGVRHDSGDPIAWGNRVIKHYEKFNIDPKSKILVFSDGLDLDSVLKIEKEFNRKIKLVYGIGTNLTNDLGIPALQNVIKQTSVNGNPTAKLSNNPNKIMCKDLKYLDKFISIIAKDLRYVYSY